MQVLGKNYLILACLLFFIITIIFGELACITLKYQYVSSCPNIKLISQYTSCSPIFSPLHRVINGE